MNIEGKKVLVNGVTGLIGSNLARLLMSKGCEIYSIDNFSYIDTALAKSKIEFIDKIHFIEGDVMKKETWDSVPADVEYIFHFAAPSSITLFNKYPEKCYQETVFGLFNALEFAKKNKTKKVIYPSSGSNYAGNKMPHKEDIYLKPRNLYAAAKVACEALASSYSDYVKSVGLRIFAGYGPGEEWKGSFASAIGMFINDCQNDRSPVIFGDGKQTRDFVYVEDVAKAIVAAAECDYTGVINVGTGKQTSFNYIVETINKVLGKNVPAVYIPKEQNYVENLMADTTLMKEVLKIEPMDLEQGIRKFVDYLNKG